MIQTDVCVLGAGPGGVADIVTVSETRNFLCVGRQSSLSKGQSLW